MLTGTLDDFTLADVFRLLSLAKRTGKLDVDRSAGTGRVFFREGEIYYADSSLTKEPLGKKLIRARVVTEAQLMEALDRSASGEGRVGEILVSSGIATTEQLQGAIKQQIEDAVFEMLRWDRGGFSWDPGVEANVEIPIAVSVENLIMESSRRLEELELIQRKVPSEDTIPGMAPSPPEGAVEINITPEEWRILVLIDGRRTVRDISSGSGWDEFTTMRTLYGLVSAGLVEILGPPAEPSEEPGVAVPGFEATTLPVPPEPVPGQVTPAAEPPAEGDTVTLPESETVVEPPPVVEELSEFPSFGDEHETASNEAPSHEPVFAGTVPPEGASSETPSDLVEALEAEPMVAAVDTQPESQPDMLPELGAPEPAGEPFLSDLLKTEPPTEPAAEAEPVEAIETQPEPLPDPTAAEAFQLEIDKAEMARELSGLFRDDRPDYRPLIPGESDGGGPPEPPKAPPVRKRVEDDEQVTKGLISRLIDGVKGL